MKTILLLFGFCCLTLKLNAQLSDSFTDTLLQDGPVWLGQPDRFKVIDSSLQLLHINPNNQNSSFIYSPLSLRNDTTTIWQITLRLDFAPSASNYAQLFLFASNPDLTSPQDAIFLKIGGISGTDDAIELYQQFEDGSQELLVAGQAGAVGQDPVYAKLEIHLNASGEWQLWASYTPDSPPGLQGIAYAEVESRDGFFGWLCHYTASRADRFFLEDCRIEPTAIDESPPKLLAVQIIDDTTLQLRFNEPVLPDDLLSVSNFSIDENNIESICETDSLHPIRTTLRLPTALVSPNDYHLTIHKLEDFAGNKQFISQAFSYLKPEAPAPGDLIITEIMADPTPSRGLPETEYFELFNLSEKAIRLDSILLQIGSQTRPLPPYLLLPDSIVLICDENDAPQFQSFSQVLAMPGMPALKNSGDRIVLFDNYGNKFFDLFYSPEWITDQEKAEGGWSLELQDVTIPFDCPLNWNGSANPAGGSPGQKNIPIITRPGKPKLLEAIPIDPYEILLRFNQPMDATFVENTAHFKFAPMLRIAQLYLQGPNTAEVLLVLDQPLKSGVVYELTINEKISNCLGEQLESTKIRIGLPENAAAGNILINELLFNPLSGEKDYLELYNNSQKVINLKDWKLANNKAITSDSVEWIELEYLLFPEAYVVLTEDTMSLRKRFPMAKAEALLQTDLPTLPDDAGNISIYSNDLLIDAFDYNSVLHHPLITDQNGVALERLSPEQDSQQTGNWHSAAATVDYGTPTLPNSQLITPISAPQDFPFHIAEPTFSPDGDGYKDVLAIAYQFESSGNSLQLSIHDLQGRTIKQLCNNTLLAQSGLLHWDGTTDEGTLAGLGIYTLFFEYFEATGRVKRQRETVVLAFPLGNN